MKLILTGTFFLIYAITLIQAQVGIGTSTPESSAMLEIQSTERGFLPPRMTSAQRNSIPSPLPGLTIYNTDNNCMEWWNGEGWFNACIGAIDTTYSYLPGTVHCDPDNPTEIVTVLNPATGRIWMDRNLGASRVAQSSTDSLAYGDLYQWGRLADGHHCRNSQTTTTLSSSDQLGHGDFITTSSLPHDWRSPENTDLWQGINGINRPCPEGFRIPTKSELQTERLSWNSNDSIGAFESPLKLTLAGRRGDVNGTLKLIGEQGGYWASTINSFHSETLSIWSYGAATAASTRAYGKSVRCIKD